MRDKACSAATGVAYACVGAAYVKLLGENELDAAHLDVGATLSVVGRYDEGLETAFVLDVVVVEFGNDCG